MLKDQCTDSKLYIAMNLAFACSLRMGEILGLTWKNVHIEDCLIFFGNGPNTLRQEKEFKSFSLADEYQDFDLVRQLLYSKWQVRTSI